jgi:hypothetical protein
MGIYEERKLAPAAGVRLRCPLHLPVGKLDSHVSKDRPRLPEIDVTRNVHDYAPEYILMVYYL